MKLTTLQKFATDLAQRAGAILLQKFGHSQIKVQKGPQDFATDADLASERLIVREIKRKFPESQIIAEESLAVQPPKSEGLVWIVDPLDGTKNFHFGLPVWGVSLACQKQGQTVLGVIYAPLTRELFVARQGQGSFCNGHRMRVSAIRELARSLVLVELPRTGEQRVFSLAALGKILPRETRIRVYGSAALELAYVARGAAEGYLDFSHTTKIWDVAAGELLIREAGGRVQQVKASLAAPLNVSLLASNGKVPFCLNRNSSRLEA